MISKVKTFKSTTKFQIFWHTLNLDLKHTFAHNIT